MLMARAGGNGCCAAGRWPNGPDTTIAAEDLNTLFASFGLPPPQIQLQAHSAISVIVALTSTSG